ncbi:MAG: aminoglycoside phosphotransferase family protein [Mycolicibacterium insubricum]|nr:aminoglycoside phosphotransferase family protein [Mycobacterium sp.]
MATSVEIPAGPDDITATWLTEVLGAPVTAVTVETVGTGQTGATYRVRPQYADPSAELPSTLVAKLVSQDQDVRARVTLGYRAEYMFYTHAADTLAVPLPPCYFCEIERDGMDFAMLLGDLAPSVQGDQIRGCSIREAELAVVALAGLHGPRWGDPEWLTFPGVTMPRPDADFAAGLQMAAVAAAETTLGVLGGRMTAADRDTLTATAEHTRDWLMCEPERFALLHGDYRLDNLLYDPERTRVTVVDWQTLSVGLPARDLAYFLGTGLPVEQRSGAERELVEAYHRALIGYGVTGYDAQSCWRDYRLGLPQITLISTFGVAFAASSERGDDMMLAMLSRGCAAIRELGTLELIDEMTAT